MKNENITTTTILLAFNIFLVLLGLLMINKRIMNTDEKSDSLKVKINQIESQLDVLIEGANSAKEKVIVANEDFIQLSNSMAVSDKILKNLDSGIKGAIKEIKEVNLNLWNIEDKLRICEKNKDFGQTFIELARGVYLNNDKRSKIKLEINNILDSNIREIKQYANY